MQYAVSGGNTTTVPTWTWTVHLYVVCVVSHTYLYSLTRPRAGNMKGNSKTSSGFL
jgi:hypothetical protein